MLVAVFGVFLLINRYTGGFMEGVLSYVLPIPIAAYTVRYGRRQAVIVFVCMCLIALIFGTFTSIFYAVSAAFIGLVLGDRLHHKADLNRTLLLTMLLAMLSELISILVIAQLTGVSIDADVKEFQTLFQQMFDKVYGGKVALPEQLQSGAMIKRIMLVAIGFTGALQGFIIYEITLIVLRKLKVPVPKPTPVSDIYPPSWTGLLGLVGYFLYFYSMSHTFKNAAVQSTAQIAGVIGFYYLMLFGIIALDQIIKTFLTRSIPIRIMLVLLGMFSLMMIVVILGYLYISGNLHRLLAERQSQQTAQKK